MIYVVKWSNLNDAMTKNTEFGTFETAQYCIQKHAKDILQQGSKTIVVCNKHTEILVEIEGACVHIDVEEKEPMTFIDCKVLNIKLV